MMNSPKLLSIFVLLFALMGCAQTPQPLGKPLPDLSYTHLNPYSPYGGSVLLMQSFQPSPRGIKTMREFPVELSSLITRYANSRFETQERAPQKPIKLVFDIQKASIIKQSDEENLVGFLSGAAENYYLLDVKLALFPLNARGEKLEPFTIKLKRELFLPQRISLAEREFRQFEFLEKVMIDIDRTITEFYNARMG